MRAFLSFPPPPLISHPDGQLLAVEVFQKKDEELARQAGLFAVFGRGDLTLGLEKLGFGTGKEGRE
jgi:hypothetical protein